jgi:hypothetical protein
MVVLVGMPSSIRCAGAGLARRRRSLKSLVIEKAPMTGGNLGRPQTSVSFAWKAPPFVRFGNIPVSKSV